MAVKYSWSRPIHCIFSAWFKWSVAGKYIFRAFFKQKISSQSDEFPGNLKIKVYFASLGEEEKFIYEVSPTQDTPTKAAIELLRDLLRDEKKIKGDSNE